MCSLGSHRRFSESSASDITSQLYNVRRRGFRSSGSNNLITALNRRGAKQGLSRRLTYGRPSGAKSPAEYLPNLLRLTILTLHPHNYRTDTLLGQPPHMQSASGPFRQVLIQASEASIWEGGSWSAAHRQCGTCILDR